MSDQFRKFDGIESDTVKRNKRGQRYLVGAFLLALLLCGCAIKFVADYDSKTEDAIFDDAKRVDLFYGKLLDTPERDRQYKAFADQYESIEADLNSLVLRNKVRPYNEDSTEIAEKILGFWQKYRGLHKQRDGYSTGNAELDRDRFRRLFAYLARAEGAKKP
ncbi:MAG TPA: hypothetical protein VL171_16555 [Verrucomicrobiae bacterium]|nr:hypothetical protein [Verrucomicrobiae bacterium]